MQSLFRTLIIIAAALLVITTAHAAPVQGSFTASYAYVDTNGYWVTVGNVTQPDGKTLTVKLENINVATYVDVPVSLSDGFLKFEDGSEDSAPMTLFSFAVGLPLVAR